jgi:hypothetical protein
MENSNSNPMNDQQDKSTPKPTEDAGAHIETVTPDTEKEGNPNDREVIPKDNDNDAQPDPNEDTEDTDDQNQSDGEEKENKNPANPELDTGQKDGSTPDVETVSA